MVRDPSPAPVLVPPETAGLSGPPAGGSVSTDPTVVVPAGQQVSPPPGGPPAPPPGAPPAEVKRRLRSFGRDDLGELALAAISGLSLSAALCLLLDWTHPLTFALWALLGVIAVEYLLVRQRLGSIVAADRLVTFLVWATAGLAVGILAWMLIYVFARGVGGLDLEFLTSDMSDVGPLDPGGGALHAIIGTLEQTLIAAAVSVPLAILTAIYLHELKGRISPVVRFITDALTGLPSIVAGLLIYALWGTYFGFSGISASFALMIIMIPIVTRTSEEMLRTVPGSLREASLALGAPRWRTVTGVVLPAARAGLVTAAILGVARIVGETAPVILTAFGSASVNTNPLGGQQADLPLMAWQLLRQPNKVQEARAWTTALVLVFVVLWLFLVARAFSEDRPVREKRKETQRS